MRKWYFLVVVLLFSIFEVTLLDSFKLFNVKPNLALMGIVIISFYLDVKWAIVLSVLTGVMKDIFSLNSFGINTLLFPLWSFLIIKLSKKILLDNEFIRAVLVFIIIFLSDIIISSVFFSLGQFIPFGIFIRILLIESIYTAFISLLLFKFLENLSIDRQ